MCQSTGAKERSRQRFFASLKIGSVSHPWWPNAFCYMDLGGSVTLTECCIRFTYYSRGGSVAVPRWSSLLYTLLSGCRRTCTSKRITNSLLRRHFFAVGVHRLLDGNLHSAATRRSRFFRAKVFGGWVGSNGRIGWWGSKLLVKRERESS